MARYIDADKFAERIKASPIFPNMGQDGYFLREFVLDLIYRQIVNIAPKSEVEMLQAEAECLKNANADLALALLYECEPTKEHLHILEATVREKVAREIFEEIEEALFNNHDLDLHSDYPTPHYYEELKDDIAELKKKYTEGDNEES